MKFRGQAEGRLQDRHCTCVHPDYVSTSCGSEYVFPTLPTCMHWENIQLHMPGFSCMLYAVSDVSGYFS